MNIPTNLKYSENHEWVNVEGELCTVGITDHAQAEMSDIVYYEAPSIGKKVTHGEAIAVVESVKAASDIYAPCDGEIVEINEALSENPSLVNEDPYGKGWFFKMKVSEQGATAPLLSAEAYEKLVR